MERIWWGWAVSLRIAFWDYLARPKPTSLFLADRVCNLLARSGDARRIRSAARRTLEALVCSPAALIEELNTAVKRPRHRRTIDQERATEALADLYDSLGDHDPKPFLVFGTLLGAIRQQGFIPGDSDLDLGIIGSARLKQFCQVILQSSLRASKLLLVDRRPSKLIIEHPNGCKIDLKSFEPEADGLSWQTRSGNLVLTKRFPYQFALKPLEFCGVNVLVPDSAEDFLEWQYGTNWRVPDSTYHVYSSGPIHGMDHQEFTDAVGPKSVLKILRHGRVAKGLGMARNMSVLFPEDNLWPRLVAAIEAALPSVSNQDP